VPQTLKAREIKKSRWKRWEKSRHPKRRIKLGLPEEKYKAYSSQLGDMVNSDFRTARQTWLIGGQSIKIYVIANSQNGAVFDQTRSLACG
jgi:hypothetical protein